MKELEVSLAALEHNLELIQTQFGPEHKIERKQRRKIKKGKMSDDKQARGGGR